MLYPVELPGLDVRTQLACGLSALILRPESISAFVRNPHHQRIARAIKKGLAFGSKESMNAHARGC